MSAQFLRRLVPTPTDPMEGTHHWCGNGLAMLVGCWKLLAGCTSLELQSAKTPSCTAAAHTGCPQTAWRGMSASKAKKQARNGPRQEEGHHPNVVGTLGSL